MKLETNIAENHNLTLTQIEKLNQITNYMNQSGTVKELTVNVDDGKITLELKI